MLDTEVRRSSFGDVRVHRHVVAGHAPIPEAPGRAFFPRTARLSQKDFEDFGYTENCRGCEFLQTGNGARQNYSDQCRLRIEAKLIKTDDGQLRIGKSKDRIDHWTAKAGDVIRADQDKNNDPCTPNGEMRTEADNNDDNDADMREDESGVGPEQFDIGISSQETRG